MSNTITVTYRELAETLKFLETWPVERTQVTLSREDCAGLGYVLTATVHGLELNGYPVTVSTNITDESSW